MKIWVEIDEERLAANFKALARALPEGVALLAVVKANAYGHGIAACVPTLAQAGAEWLGVTDTDEGIAVRATLAEAGIARARQPQVLVMSGMTGAEKEAEAIVAHALTPVIWTAEHLRLLEDAARRAGVAQVPVHLEIETGMARQGAAVGAELAAMLAALAAAPKIALDGVYTHFAATEVAHSGHTRRQQQFFEQAVEQVAAAGLRPRWLHVGNSSYIDNGADASALDWVQRLAMKLGARAMVRAGLGLYGYLLPIEGAGTARVQAELRPVMAWKTQVIGLREVEAGATVGYNGTFVAERAMRLALLPAGYADGLRRELSGANGRDGGWVIVRGARAPILGRVSMNLTVVDVTAIEGVRVGDPAVLLGDGVTADDHARLAGTIAYEILCAVRTDT